jgi:F0F1-type ATP synthase membrane subunit b/b'
MDTVLQILGQLGANESFWYQLIIFFIVFIISGPLFVKLLQETLELRQEKTTGLSQHADEQLKEINKISLTVKESLNQIKKETREEFNDKKQKLIKDLEKEYRKNEQEVSSFATKKRMDDEKELEEMKVHLDGDVTKFALSLSDKIIK